MRESLDDRKAEILRAVVEEYIDTAQPVGSSRIVQAGGLQVSAERSADRTGPTLLSLAELERRHIRRALTMTGGHLAHAAESLGIHRNTLRRKLQEYGMDSSAQVPADLPDEREEGQYRRAYSRVAEGA